MFAQISTALLGLSALSGVALAGVAVPPNDPHADIAATATSYEDFAIKIAAVATTPDTPVPSPVMSAEELEVFNSTSVEREFHPRMPSLLAAHGNTDKQYAAANRIFGRQSRVSCSGVKCFVSRH